MHAERDQTQVMRERGHHKNGAASMLHVTPQRRLTRGESITGMLHLAMPVNDGNKPLLRRSMFWFMLVFYAALFIFNAAMSLSFVLDDSSAVPESPTTLLRDSSNEPCGYLGETCVLTPTAFPTVSPTDSPSESPTTSPTNAPTTPAPSDAPTQSPTDSPSVSPTSSPSASPSASPTVSPSLSPATPAPVV